MHEEVRMSGINSAQKFQKRKKRIKQLFKTKAECKFADKVPLQQNVISNYLVCFTLISN